MKILITGGGTGGHLYPALAVADALKPRLGGEKILFVGSSRGMESREVPEAGYAFRGLDSEGFPRKPSLKLLKAAWSAVGALRVARAIIGEFRPDVVFSTGGYASAPVVLAAWLSRVPIVLHEQNSVPGRANRLASRVADRVFLGFSSARRFFPRRDHLRLSGNPLREQVLSGSRSRALRQFRLEEARKTVLVLGGSQGAHSINQAIVDALGYFGERDDVQFLIQCGQRDHDWMVERCREQPAKSWVRRFIPNMGDAYEIADLVVARAGAMTISELSACGLPSILVPYPHAMDDHQKLNAEQLREGGAALVIEDRFLSGKDLHAQIVALLEDPSELRLMAMNARRMARPEATQTIADSLLEFGTDAEVVPPLEERREERSRGPRPEGAERRDRRGAGDRPSHGRFSAPAGGPRDGGERRGREPGREGRPRGVRPPVARGPNVIGAPRANGAELERSASPSLDPAEDAPVLPEAAAGDPAAAGRPSELLPPRPASGRRRRRRRGGSSSRSRTADGDGGGAES